jgi:hypothetical protein
VVSIETISIVIAAVSVVIGVINSIRSNQKAEEQRQTEIETRQAQLFTQIHSWWRSRDAVKAYGNLRYKYYEDLVAHNMNRADYLKKYGAAADSEAYADHLTLWAFFEGIGVLVKKDLIDVELVEDLFSGRIIWIYEHFIQPSLEEIRKGADDPTQWDSFEYLYNTMKQREPSIIVRS